MRRDVSVRGGPSAAAVMPSLPGDAREMSDGGFVGGGRAGDGQRDHIKTYGVGKSGRIFNSERGKPVASTAYTEVWQQARILALTPEQVASPLAARPYDLRHAAVSLWLNGGVSPTEIAKRAGHSVEVLLRVYANCVVGQDKIANRRIEEILAQDPDGDGENGPDGGAEDHGDAS